MLVLKRIAEIKLTIQSFTIHFVLYSGASPAALFHRSSHRSAQFHCPFRQSLWKVSLRAEEGGAVKRNGGNRLSVDRAISSDQTHFT